MPLRGVLRRSRLPERNRHAGDFWGPNACLMAVWGQGEPESSRKRRARGVLAIVLARDRSLGAIECEPLNVRALQAAQPRARNSAADAPASRHTFGQRIHTHIDTEQLASTAPSHSTSADKHPRTPTGGRENGAEASVGWKGAGGGSEGRGGREYGAEGRQGRTGPGVWGGAEYGAEGRLGRKPEARGVCQWGGREYGAEGSMGRKAHPDTPTSTLTLKLRVRHFSARRGRHTLLLIVNN
jgi:hypothetical protein